MRTLDWKSGDLSSRLGCASAHNMILGKLGAYFETSVSAMFIMSLWEQMSQRDHFYLEYCLV